MLVREIKEEMEKKTLSPYATLSAESRGRLRTEAECSTRSCFQRDTGRILYSLAFRRLRQKTQVFSNPKNDHICTRMEHVLYVSYIARTIGAALGLNTDLIEAIALGHDLGHAPFGHSGERELDACLQEAGSLEHFQHEAHSLRVVDILTDRRPGVHGLNLSFEVRDGIISHCGERYGEAELCPNPEKTEEELRRSAVSHDAPATLEGCVVRFADRIAFVGRDIEDAKRSGLMSFQDIPQDIQAVLGHSNSEVTNNLVSDIIEHSQGRCKISISGERAEALEALLEESVSHIYRSEKLMRYTKIAREMVRGLFFAFLEASEDPERLAQTEEPVLKAFYQYFSAHPEREAGSARKVCDYIAGMSDPYATAAFQELYQI